MRSPLPAKELQGRLLGKAKGVELDLGLRFRDGRGVRGDVLPVSIPNLRTNFRIRKGPY